MGTKRGGRGVCAQGIFDDLGLLAASRTFFTASKASNYATTVRAWRGGRQQNLGYGMVPAGRFDPRKHAVQCEAWKRSVAEKLSNVGHESQR